MKKIKFLVLVALFVASTSAMAQQKIGVITTQQLLISMPEIDSVNSELGKVRQSLITDMDAMNTEYTKKMQEYQSNKDSYTQVMREQKEKDLQTLTERLRNYQSVAEQEMMEQENILMRPVRERLMNAINKVANDNSFAMVLDKSSAVFISETLTEDLTPLVMKELGIEKLMTAEDLQKMQQQMQ